MINPATVVVTFNVAVGLILLGRWLIERRAARRKFEAQNRNRVGL